MALCTIGRTIGLANIALLAVPLSLLAYAFFEAPSVTVLSQAPSSSSYPAAGSAAAERGSPTAGQAEAEAASAAMGTMFDRAAFAYDATSRTMTLGLDQHWRRTLINECMALQGEDRVLDLATGTADVGVLVGTKLRELGAQGEQVVLGLDPSSEMLRRGVAKVGDRGLSGFVRLVQGDAQNLTSMRDVDAEGRFSDPTAGVESGSIDKISMAFGIRSVNDRVRVFREMHRVLRSRPSSRVCILEFALPSEEKFVSNVVRTFILYVFRLMAMIATLGSGSEQYQYLQGSILNFPKPLDFAALMTQEGLQVLSVTTFAMGSVQLYAAAPAP